MSKREDKNGIAQVIVDNKIRIGLIICIVYIVIIGISILLTRDSGDTLETIYYVSQITSGFFVVAGTGIAVIQYISNSNIARKEADKQRKIEAAKMANEFKEKVLPLINQLSIGYSDEKLLKEIIEYLDNSKLESFNYEELLKLFPKKSYLRYRALVAQVYLSRTDSKYVALQQKYRACADLGEKEKIEKELNEYVYEGIKQVNSITTDLSNSLEYMCICFNTNIADDETVYQSLHSAFFLAVHMIYIWTFEMNTNEHDRLFYNVMVLYKKWKKLNREKKKEEEKNREKMEEELNSLKAQYHDQITVSTRCE